MFRVLTKLYGRCLVPRTRFASSIAELVPKNVKPAKKKPAVHKLRQTDPAFVHESTKYILSLLSENGAATRDGYFATSKMLDKYLSPVTSLTVGESIDLKAVKGEVVIPDEVVMTKYEGHDVMVLSNGTVVGWGFTESEMVDAVIRGNAIKGLVDQAVVEEYETWESEEMDWVELNVTTNEPLNQGNSYLQGEIMVLQGPKKILDKAAFAIGMSRLTRLLVLENSLEQHLQLSKSNAEHLSKGLRITTSELAFLQLTGKLFLLRGRLNLYLELIETPDLYWTEPTLEKIYDSVSKTLDINSRILILNRKLDYATDEQRAFLTVLSEKKGTRLEWIIIILIMVEVAFELFHFYEDYKHRPNMDKSKGTSIQSSTQQN